MDTWTEADPGTPAASAADLRGEEWIAGAAHDLKQPLAVLADRVRDDVARSAVEQIRLGIEELLDGFNAARLRKLSRTTFALDALMETARDTCNIRGPGAGMHIDIRPCGLWLHGPRGLCYRVLLNLLLNAVTHSRASKVVVECQAMTAGVRITVQDDGFGIPRDLLHAVYQRYLSGRTEGTALSSNLRGRGILTALQLVGAMGGKLQAISHKQGTTWHCDLPLELAARPLSVPQHSDGMLAGRNVFVLDDDHRAGEATGRRFADLGASVRNFTHPLPMFTAAEHGDGEVDLFVLDFLLSDGDATPVIEMLSDYRKAPPIVIVTANSGHPRLRSVTVPVYAKPLTDTDVGVLCEMILGRPS